MLEWSLQLKLLRSTCLKGSIDSVRLRLMVLSSIFIVAGS